LFTAKQPSFQFVPSKELIVVAVTKLLNLVTLAHKKNVTVSIPEGETCTFKVKTRRGVPAFKPNNTNGFDIAVLDYDDDDLAA